MIYHIFCGIPLDRIVLLTTIKEYRPEEGEWAPWICYMCIVVMPSAQLELTA